MASLHPSQLRYILNDAEDKVLFIDEPFVEALAAAAAVGPLPHLRAVVVLADALSPEAHAVVSASQLGPAVAVLAYEPLIQVEAASFPWVSDLDERAASSMCYTSGTTGLPKGCLFSHRSTVLHTYGACTADGFGVTHADAVLSVVPMYHVNGWGLPYAAAMVGAKLVFPGSRLDGPALYEQLSKEEVSRERGK